MQRTLVKTISIIVLLALLLPFGSGHAQEADPTGPIYIVQEGDSLWDIAARFHVAPSALANANGVSNADEISIGQQLIIPGLEGIHGILTTQIVAYGESLRSLSLRYKITPRLLMRLNRLTSPSELYAGYSLIIPQNDALNPGRRAMLNPGQSLLELAIINHSDPWSLVLNNDIQSSSVLTTGEVLRTQGEDDSGPGALPPAVQSVTIPRLTQGQTAEIDVTSSSAAGLSGSLTGHTLNFFPDGIDQYVALQGIHAMQEAGIYPLTLRITSSDNVTHEFSQMVMVHSGDFPYDRSLSVDPATLDPESNRKENELWSNAASKVSPDKMWEGSFSNPVDPVFAGCYPSKFGNRRSYNGGAYLYFHTGLDMCSQVGDPIYAAAPGVVVFTGLLTVRGNATMIDHGWGVYTTYMHQSEILVNIGDSVEEGQLIGRIGRTGRAEGPHLHFEVFVGGVQVDPLEWLEGVFPTVKSP